MNFSHQGTVEETIDLILESLLEIFTIFNWDLIKLLLDCTLESVSLASSFVGDEAHLQECLDQLLVN